MNKIDRMLACLGIFMLLFVPAVLVVFVITGGNEPTMLVGGITASRCCGNPCPLPHQNREAKARV